MQGAFLCSLLALWAGFVSAACTRSKAKAANSQIATSSQIQQTNDGQKNVTEKFTNNSTALIGPNTSTTSSLLSPITGGIPGSSPASNISLVWGQNDTMVTVGLSMNYSAVVLEQLTSVSSVDCDASSVRVSFSSADEFALIQASWSSLNGTFVLITNHMGDCDTEFERGFFLADVESLSFSASNLTAQAQVEKSDVASTSDDIVITFSNMPTSATRRSISLDEKGLDLKGDISLPPATKLFSYENYVTVTADRAELSVNTLYSGILRYSIAESTLREWTFDVTNTLSQDIALTFDFTAPYTYEFRYNVAPLSYPIIEIPGIITLGPALTLAIGADFTVEASLGITTEFSSQIKNGGFHIDFLNPSLSTATNWAPTHSASANITAEAGVIVAPFVSATVEMQAKILLGLLDLSTGATVKPKFPISFDLATSAAAETAASTPSVAASCPNGFGVNVGFELDVILFASEWASLTFDVYNAEIGSYCYDWF